MADDWVNSALEQRSVLALKGDAEAIRKWMHEVAGLRTAFEARWTLLALRRVNPDLHEALREQMVLFDEMLITGSAIDVDEHGAAMCKGWRAAIKAMEAEPDDAYLIGYDGNTGMRLAIGNNKSAERVQDLHGNECVFLTPDEVAGLLGACAIFERVGEVKKLFPGAEIVEIRK